MGTQDNLKVLYQEDKGCDKKKPYAGTEKRDTPRIDDLPLTPENRTLLREIINRTPKGCGDNCIIPDEFKPHMGHAVAIVREKGGSGGIESGLTKFRDQDKQLEKILSTRTKIIDKAVMVIAIALLILGLKELGWM